MCNGRQRSCLKQRKSENIMTKKAYKCSECGKEIVSEEDKTHECCGKEMKQIPLDQCTQPHEAEYSGPFEEDQPCDDGRAGS